jgi:hypothetical protein
VRILRHAIENPLAAVDAAHAPLRGPCERLPEIVTRIVALARLGDLRLLARDALGDRGRWRDGARWHAVDALGRVVAACHRDTDFVRAAAGFVHHEHGGIGGVATRPNTNVAVLGQAERARAERDRAVRTQLAVTSCPCCADFGSTRLQASNAGAVLAVASNATANSTRIIRARARSRGACRAGCRRACRHARPGGR